MAPKRKPSVIYLRDKAYRVRIPAGLAASDGSPSEWDSLLAKLSSEDALFHWSFIWSWCQEPFPCPDQTEASLQNFMSPPHRTLRGCTTAGFLSTATSGTRGSYIGYRPVLDPVFPDTLEPDPSRWAHIPDGEILPLGTLYMNGQPFPLPKYPTDTGDIPDYIPGSDLYIGQTHTDPAYQIQMIKCDNLLISDRNLLKNVSWTDLDRCGLVFGEKPKARAPKLFSSSPALSRLAIRKHTLSPPLPPLSSDAPL